ncbi:MAG TPA: PAS domain S-box protein [Burkholderiales bacterium]
MGVRKARVQGRKGGIRRARAVPSLGHLSSDWYWEQDRNLRFTRVEVNSAAISEKRLARLLIGKTRWDTGIETEGGWGAHRAALERREPFRDLVAWRTFEDGSRRYMLVTGEPKFDARGRFTGYRGIGRDITSQKRAESLRALEHAVTRLFAELPSASQALEAAIRVICETESWQCGRYLWVDSAAGVVRHGADWCESENASIQRYIVESRAMVYERGTGLVGKVWESEDAMWVPDITDDARVARPGLARSSGLRGTFVVPVAAEAKTIGVLIFHSRRARQRDEALLQTLRVVGTQIGQFLQRMQSEQAMRESEARFRSLTELSSDWYWEQDREFRFVRLAGRGAAANAGQGDPTTYLGKTRWDTPDLAPVSGTWDAHRAQLARHEAFRDLVLRREMADGSVRFMAISGEPIFDAAGRFDGYRGVGRDITDLKRTEEDLLRFRAAMDSSADMIVLVDRASMRFVDVNSTVCRLLGYTREELLAKRPEEILPVTRAELEAAYDRQIADPSVPAGMRSSYLCKDGSRLPFESRRQVIRSGAHWLISVVSRDIRERIEAETALSESEARFRALTHLSSDWYWEQDAEYRFTRLEGRYLTGGDAHLQQVQQRLLGQRRWESGLEIEGGWDAHRALLEAREPFHDVVMWRTRPDGVRRFISVSGEPIIEPDGRFTGYRGVGRDVTEQKRAEELIRLEHHVALALADAPDASSGLQSVLRAFCEAEGWACARYFELDESASLLRFRDAWSSPDPWAERFIQDSRGLTYSRGEGLCGKVWETGDTVWTKDSLSDARVKAKGLAQDTGIRGAFVLPVVADGRVIGAVSCTSKTVREPDDRLRQAALVIGRQIGQFMQRKRAEEALRESEARFRGLTQMSSDFYWETDAQHRFTQMVHGPDYASKFGPTLIGKAAWELPSTAPDEVGWATLRASFDAHEAFRDFEFGRPWPDGSTRYFTVTGEPRFAPDGSFLGYRGVGRETTEIALAREHIASLAYSDTLTGLANRTSLGPAFEQAVERARRRSTRLAALFIDLDGFKPVNDAHGHSAGDRILVEVSRRLRASLRASDLVARIGGDEFFVVLEEIQDSGTLEIVARKLLGELARPYELSSAEQAHISASIGISLYPSDAPDAAALMKHADMAMYAAKQAGKNALRFYASGEVAEARVRSKTQVGSTP